MILLMPSTMSLERRIILKALGAELHLTDVKIGIQGMLEKTEEILSKTPGGFVPQQFENPANPEVYIISCIHPQLYVLVVSLSLSLSLSPLFTSMCINRKQPLC